MLFILLVLLSFFANAQQLQMTDFAVFSANCPFTGSTTPASPGAASIIGCGSIVNGGSVGSKKFVQTTGPATINGNVNSLGMIDLAANAVVTGKITAANSMSLTGTTISVASASSIGGNMDVSGNITVVSGTISGKVTHPI